MTTQDRATIEDRITRHLTTDGQEHHTGFAYHVPGTVSVLLSATYRPMEAGDVLDDAFLSEHEVEVDTTERSVSKGLMGSRPMTVGKKCVTTLYVTP